MRDRRSRRGARLRHRARAAEPPGRALPVQPDQLLPGAEAPRAAQRPVVSRLHARAAVRAVGHALDALRRQPPRPGARPRHQLLPGRPRRAAPSRVRLSRVPPLGGGPQQQPRGRRPLRYRALRGHAWSHRLSRDELWEGPTLADGSRSPTGWAGTYDPRPWASLGRPRRRPPHHAAPLPRRPTDRHRPRQRLELRFDPDRIAIRVAAVVVRGHPEASARTRCAGALLEDDLAGALAAYRHALAAPSTPGGVRGHDQPARLRSATASGPPTRWRSCASTWSATPPPPTPTTASGRLSPPPARSKPSLEYRESLRLDPSNDNARGWIARPRRAPSPAFSQSAAARVWGIGWHLPAPVRLSGSLSGHLAERPGDRLSLGSCLSRWEADTS